MLFLNSVANSLKSRIKGALAALPVGGVTKATS